MAIISIHNLKVKYDEITALENVTLDINKNEFVGIIGPNGGGKTTLVKTILGLLKPVNGNVKISKNEVIGYVPQLTTFDRKFPINVMDVILTGHLPKQIKIGKRFNKHDKSHALSIMKRLDIENLKYRQIGTLSGGQMQRVLISRALMNHPTVLILDEPTAGVDRESKQEIYKMLKELNENITILMVTHNTSKLLPMLDKVIYINKTAHIHDKTVNSSNTIDSCPIDWFIQGEEIQQQLLKFEGAKK